MPKAPMPEVQAQVQPQAQPQARTKPRPVPPAPEARRDGTVRDAVFALLRRHGMTRIFGNPGSTELPMFTDLPEDFSYVAGLQESVVVAMADGHAQASRKPAFVNLHSAAGVGHAMGSIYSAYRNRAPVIITAGQQSRPLLKADPFLFAEAATDLPRPYVKWAIEPARAEDVPAVLARAIEIACLPPMGPVFVSIPLDDWAQPCPPLPGRAVQGKALPDPAALRDLAARLAEASDPVLVVGAGVDQDNGWSEVIALAEHHQTPVWAAPLSSRCSFPESHPLFAGFLTATEADIARSLAGHDLILVLGAPVFTYHYERPAQIPPAGAALVQIVSDPHQAAGAVCGEALVGDLALSMRALVAGPARPRRDQPMRRLRQPDQAPAITSAMAMKALADLRPRDGIVVEEAPSSRDNLHDFLPIDRPGGFFATASGGLGYALPAAVGVALTKPAQPVLAILGDGSSMYAIQGIWSAVEQDADVLFVIFNNGGYAALSHFAGNKPVVGCTIGHLSLAAIAEAQGCPAVQVSDPAALEPVLRKAFAARGPRLVEILLDHAGRDDANLNDSGLDDLGLDDSGRDPADAPAGRDPRP